MKETKEGIINQIKDHIGQAGTLTKLQLELYNLIADVVGNATNLNESDLDMLKKMALKGYADKIV